MRSGESITLNITYPFTSNDTCLVKASDQCAGEILVAVSVRGPYQRGSDSQFAISVQFSPSCLSIDSTDTRNLVCELKVQLESSFTPLVEACFPEYVGIRGTVLILSMPNNTGGSLENLMARVLLPSLTRGLDTILSPRGLDGKKVVDIDCFAVDGEAKVCISKLRDGDSTSILSCQICDSIALSSLVSILVDS